MKSPLIKSVMLCALALPLLQQGQAQVHGVRQLGLEIGQIWVGDSDVRTIDDKALLYGVQLRLPLHENIELTAFLRESKLDGHVEVNGLTLKHEVTTSDFGGGLQFNFAPRKEINPFVGVGFLRSRVEVEVGDASVKDRDTGLSIAGGLEVMVDHDASMILSVGYQDIFNDTDVVTAASLNKWFVEDLLVSLGFSYGFRSEDATLKLGGGLRF